MKRGFLILAVIFLTFPVFGQQKLDVIASAGGYNVSGSGAISISWTLGETIIPNFTSQDGTISLAHGFQQKLIITKIDETIDDPVTVTVYPNPVSDIVKIEFEQPVESDVKVYLIDFKGKMVGAEMIGSGSVLHEMNMQNLPAGIYYLRLQKGRLINVYRVIKL